MSLIQLLTNENQILINILDFLVSILESFLFYKTSTIILRIHPDRKRSILFISVNCIVGNIIKIIPNTLIKDLINIICFIISIQFIFEQKIKNTFLALIFSYLSAIISGGISQTLSSLFFNMKIEEMISIPIFYIVIWGLSTLIWSLILLFLKLVISSKKIDISNIPVSDFIPINLLLGIVTIALESYLLSVYTDLIPIELTITIILTLLLYFAISMYSIVRTNRLEQLKMDLDNEISYNKTLSHLHDNIRCFKHDFNNIIQSIGGYIAMDDMKGLNKYYEKLLAECKLTNNLNLLNPETINNPPIYSLLTNKYYIAAEKNIDITFSIFTDLSKINFNTYEISRILGILLDNAIEAAEESEEKKIEIEFKSDNNRQLFIIKNSYSDPNISTTKIFEKGYSTKKHNSGIGLWKVHKILSKNSKLDLFTTVKDNMFSQQLEIFY